MFMQAQPLAISDHKSFRGEAFVFRAGRYVFFREKCVIIIFLLGAKASESSPLLQFDNQLDRFFHQSPGRIN